MSFYSSVFNAFLHILLQPLSVSFVEENLYNCSACLNVFNQFDLSRGPVLKARIAGGTCVPPVELLQMRHGACMSTLGSARSAPGPNVSGQLNGISAIQCQ